MSNYAVVYAVQEYHGGAKNLVSYLELYGVHGVYSDVNNAIEHCELLNNNGDGLSYKFKVDVYYSKVSDICKQHDNQKIFDNETIYSRNYNKFIDRLKENFNYEVPFDIFDKNSDTLFSFSEDVDKFNVHGFPVDNKIKIYLGGEEINVVMRNYTILGTNFIKSDWAFIHDIKPSDKEGEIDIVGLTKINFYNQLSVEEFIMYFYPNYLHHNDFLYFGDYE